jgi:hypothetical protein
MALNPDDSANPDTTIKSLLFLHRFNHNLKVTKLSNWQLRNYYFDNFLKASAFHFFPNPLLSRLLLYSPNSGVILDDRS